ncbi:Sulfate transporter ychM [Candidatus Ornithobacterium hominis]|uniref:SulP family inorganic anion transporter n=1 Tax=Candidatus Ornithobacterium hominis TaxID=2497989 RepID=UPI0024BCCEEE|nr:SulP family inorganic anion transporter [Candidatus Ornithobacterium hominis]CAI9428780.1 Sulfate transporter ychM [Candidatus Ornithobacterium hominis]
MFKNLFNFNFKHFKGDLFGGITGGIVALPLALAFGVSSGLGPSAGLYGAIFLAFFAALFGGTKTQISGPTAPMTAVSMVIIAGIIGANEGDVEKAMPGILTVFLLAGLIQILMGFLGLGKYIKYIPYPVVSGFMTAIGVIIIITQLLPMMGYYPKEDQDFVNEFRSKAEAVLLKGILEEEAGEDILVLEDFKKTVERADQISEIEILAEAKTLAGNEASGVVGAVKMLPRAIQKINLLELALALGTVIIIYGFKKITTVIPSNLVALIVMTLVALIFKLDYRPIEEIPSGFPMPNFGIITEFDLGIVTPYIFTALTLALLGSIDSLLTSVVADNMTKTKHQPNQELVGQGIGNGVAAFFGGLPGAGATIRTVVNINAGGKTRLSGMFAGVLLLVVSVALGPVASKIPAAVLAGILITVGVGVMDYKGLKAIPNIPKDVKIGSIKFSMEVLIMIIVLLLSTFWNLVNAVGIGLVIASLMFMKKMGDFTAQSSSITALKNLALEDQWADELHFPEKLKEEVFIKHLNGPVFFGNTGDIKALSEDLPETTQCLVILMDNVPYLDQSGVYTFEDILLEMNQKNIITLLVGVNKQPEYLMQSIGIIPNLISEDYLFDDFKSCLYWIEKNIEDTH